MVLTAITVTTVTTGLIRDQEKRGLGWVGVGVGGWVGGGGVWRWGEREIVYLSLHCQHQNDSCIKMGSDENRFNVSLIVKNSHRTMSTVHNL